MRGWGRRGWEFRAGVVVVIAVAALAARAVRAETAPTVECRPAEKFVCQMGQSCVGGGPGNIGPIDAWANLYVSSEATVYERCDSKGCDPWPAVSSMSGETIVVEIPGRGAFAKISPNGSWTEVVSQSTTVFVTYGYCRPL